MKVSHMETTRSLREISKLIAQYLWQHEHMETDRFMTSDGEYIVQGRVRNGHIRQWFGLDKRIRIRWRQQEHRCACSIDCPAMKDKIIVVCVSLLGLWPLLFVSIFGLCDQLLLPRRLRRVIDTLD